MEHPDGQCHCLGFSSRPWNILWGYRNGVENVTCACLTGRRQNVAFLKIRDDTVLTGNLLPTFRKRLVPPNNLQFCNLRQHCGKRQTSHILNPICIRWDPASDISPQTDYSEAAATATQMPESYSILGGDHVTIVAAVTGLRARLSGVSISEQQQIFSFSKAYGLARVHPDSCSKGTGILSQR
jgi:hypothetical protein